MTDSATSVRWPAAVAAASPDLISLRDHVMDIEIGAFQQERGIRQSVRFTLVAALVRRPGAALTDDVDTILSYDLLRDAIADELAIGRINLLETLAERIAARVLCEPQVAHILVRIEKLDRCSGDLGVEITRHQGDTGGHVVEPPPSASRRILVLPETALTDPALPGVIDRLAGAGGGILTLAAHWPDPEDALVPAVQRRIDLLALDQAAWRLAARDPRCVVVAARTELDWGLREGQISVWAPAKLAADARHLPRPLREGGVSMLARWLAGQMGLLFLSAADADPSAPGASLAHLTFAASSGR